MPINTESDFWAKAARETGSDCMIWQGSKNRTGYGYYSLRGKTVYAHRYSWQISNKAEIPKGKVIMHSCDNPSCVNPAHLSLGTYTDNAQDRQMKNRGRKDYPSASHCSRGHELAGDNLIGNTRHCRTCAKARRALKQAEARATKPAKTHCVNGHERTPENTYVAKTGWKQCRVCHKESERAQRTKKQSR